MAARVRDGLGTVRELRALIEHADSNLFPAVVQAASRPETERSERFAVYFAIASACPGPDDADREELPDGLLRVVREAAIQRSSPALRDTAKLWFAEMYCDPEVADDVADLFESFVDEAPHASGDGAAAYAIYPSARLVAD